MKAQLRSLEAKWRKRAKEYEKMMRKDRARHNGGGTDLPEITAAWGEATRCRRELTELRQSMP